jgi:hypothetical protein
MRSYAKLKQIDLELTMKKVLSVALLAPALVHSAPCPSGSYEVGPYVALEGQVSKIKLGHNISAKRSLKPIATLGLKVHENAALELTAPLSSHKHKVKDVTSNETVGPITVTRVEKKADVLRRQLDLRLIGRAPIDWQADSEFLYGLGVSHLKLAQSHLKQQKLVPSALIGAEFGTNSPLKVRLTATYAHGLKSRIEGVKAKHNLAASAGLVWHL